jgi:antitoxin VapB
VARRALETQLAQARRAAPVKDRLARAKALADALGTSDPGFDMKAYTDAIWGGA